MLLRDAFGDGDIFYACTDPKQGDNFPKTHFFSVSDYNRNNPLLMMNGVLEVRRLVKRIRPDVIISTGAAPGLIALAYGKIIGARTIWVDSIANSQKMSLSGKIALKFCDTTVTQWEHLALPNGPHYLGSVI